MFIVEILCECWIFYGKMIYRRKWIDNLQQYISRIESKTFFQLQIILPSSSYSYSSSSLSVSFSCFSFKYLKSCWFKKKENNKLTRKMILAYPLRLCLLDQCLFSPPFPFLRGVPFLSVQILLYLLTPSKR